MLAAPVQVQQVHGQFDWDLVDVGYLIVDLEFALTSQDRIGN